MADEAADRWWLDDAERLAAENPHSFFIPPAKRRMGLREGDSVKLIFLFATRPGVDVGGERMWVEVRETSEGRYVGELLNQPEHIRGLRAGDLVAFEPKHVAAFAYDVEELGYDPEAVAVASRRLRDDDAWPAFVYRNPPKLRGEEDDSGWQLFAAEDDDEFVSDPDNVLWWKLGWIADRYPEVEALFRRDEEAGEWVWDDRLGGYARRDSQAG